MADDRTTPYYYKTSDNPITDINTLRENSAKWDGLLKEFSEKHNLNLWQFDSLSDFVAFQKNNPQIRPILPSEWDNRLSYEEYYANFPQGSISEWERVRETQQRKEVEAKEHENLLKRQSKETVYRADQAMGALGIATLPGVSYFALADTMQDDRRYKKIVKNLPDVKNWQKQNPKEKLFVKRTLSNGRKIKGINPLLKQAVFDVHDQAEVAFEKKHKWRAKRYKEKERRRVYNNIKEDPSYNKLRKGLDQKNLQAFQSYAPGQAGAAMQLQQTTKLMREKEYQDWVRTHPEKAKEYSRQDPNMKQAFDRYSWEKKQNRLSRRLFRKLTGRPSPTAPTPKKRAIRQAIRDWYNDKKKQLKQQARQYATSQGRRVAWNATKSAAKGSYRVVSRGGGPVIRGGGRAGIRAAGQFGRLGARLGAMLTRALTQAAARLAVAAFSNPITWIVI
ncbi:MAG: hypothetical protein HYT11_02195, partial [Candidatus Levybacteria bacterium]|nr:hypothetical protein [Candidatus Levybacteria bacterium]